jgi:hypothetical protein
MLTGASHDGSSHNHIGLRGGVDQPGADRHADPPRKDLSDARKEGETAGEDAIALTPGELANNGMQVQGLQKLLTGSETNLSVLSRVIKSLQNSNAWCAFSFHKYPDQVFRWSAADFRKFIEADRPSGCQTPLYVLERMLRETDAWESFLELTRGTPGNPTGANQYNGGKYDSIILSSVEPSKKPPCGTSVSYALRRLSKNRPDLYEQVKAQELSANAAMIQAGFKDKTITVPIDVKKAAKVLVRNFDVAELLAAIDEVWRRSNTI